MSKRISQGTCPTCNRYHRLTFHHLIPKKMHRRTFFRKNVDKSKLTKGIYICRQCHDGIHKMYDEMHLAKHLNTLEALLADQQLQSFFQWVSKQKIIVKR